MELERQLAIDGEDLKQIPVRNSTSKNLACVSLTYRLINVRPRHV